MGAAVSTLVPVDVDGALLRRWPLPQPAEDDDKDARGQVLVVAGSREMPGAAWLSATAALRAGAGKLVVATAASVAAVLAARLPEARVIALPEADDGGLQARGVALLEEVLARSDGLLVGPGMLNGDTGTAFVRALLAVALDDTDAAVVLDAAAMDAVTPAVSRPVLLTPHAGEMARLCGQSKEAVCEDRTQSARAAAARLGAVLAFKGASTVVATPDGRAWQHDGGSVGLATSGSGDVLAGVVAGLAARGAALEQAAVWGVVLHALAGQALASRIGPLGFLASELAAEVPGAMRSLAALEDR